MYFFMLHLLVKIEPLTSPLDIEVKQDTGNAVGLTHNTQLFARPYL